MAEAAEFCCLQELEHDPLYYYIITDFMFSKLFTD
ncbi:Uncharacterised protein [Chlamydia abortus]|nr:Uncharacterised protein [Chlamydia abortus]SGA30987.1 Uncharacterised protein [Chlamydia abortus]SGA31323.1 Uncharacterised protein [Chlamydia abortus]